MNPCNEEQPVDFALVYSVKPEYFEDEDDLNKWRKKERLRVLFEDAMFREGLRCQEERIGKNVFVQIHCPFSRLCQQAEKIKLEMPLKVEANDTGEKESAAKVISMLFKVNQKPSRYLSAPFRVLIADQFLGYEYPDMFFRSALRSLLVEHVLNGINIQDKLAETEIEAARSKGLAYMLLKKAYTDCFIFHDKTKRSESRRASVDILGDDASLTTSDAIRKLSMVSEMSNIEDHFDFGSRDKGPVDTRSQLSKTWNRFFKPQPMWLIRNYFGEKIAFYFAWEGTLISSLIIPAILGIIIFGIGVPVAIEQLDHGSHFLNNTKSVSAYISYYLEVVKIACDNKLTPWFAFIICLWGTIFLEIWKRVRATQSFRWGVDHFHETEPVRPEFHPTHVRHDTVLKTSEMYYPVYFRLLKYVASACISALMICVVLLSVTMVIIFRLYVVNDYCPHSEVCQFTLATLAPALMNTFSILLLGKIYSWIAVKLSNWENHRTTSEYNSALIIKLFAFQFANTYASLFYLAFIRGRYADFSFLNLSYVDACCEKSCQGSAASSSGNCMSMLTFQVLVLMVVKPFPRFFKDIILPAIKKCFRRIKCSNKISPEKLDIFTKEKLKPKLGEFTREELTEKVVMYGFLLLFAASFPLAPLIALVTMTIDMRIDATRLLFWNRRPTAYRHHGIGIWFEIIQFVNLCGVVTNGLLITFTSSYGKFETLEWKLFFFICFEHAVFGVRYVITKLIPDVPQSIKQAQRKEKSLVTDSLIEGMRKHYEEKNCREPNEYSSGPNSPERSPAKNFSTLEKYKNLYRR